MLYVVWKNLRYHTGKKEICKQNSSLMVEVMGYILAVCTPGFPVGFLRQNWVTPKTVSSIANYQQIDLAQHHSKFCDARHAMQNRRLYNDNTRRRRRFVANLVLSVCGGGAVGTRVRRVCSGSRLVGAELDRPEHTGR